MRTSPTVEPAARLNIRTLKQKRLFTRALRRRTGTRACYIELPQNLWDRTVFLVFTCCLFTFLRAFFGFGVVDGDFPALKDPFVLPRATPSIPSQWNWGSGALNGDQKMRGRGMTRVMVDWHGNYELLPSTTSALVSHASVPQDGFPDPTPALVRAGGGRTMDESSLSMTTKAKTPVDNPFAFYGTPYDPFRLEFGDSANGEVRGLYPIAEPPKTTRRGARTRRFGRCLPGEACL